ncbi:MAG: cytochrome P450 [Acidimicrobiales bacterium]
MNQQVESSVAYDPYDVGINADPYPVFGRLRREAPLYYNEEFDFYAVSRFDDVERGLRDNVNLISGRGAILELIQADIELPSGTVIFEDPPTHTMHRKLMSRMFTPKKVAALEPQIRQFCARALDPLVGGDRFDFVKDLGDHMPMRVIGMLLGIPEDDQEDLRRGADGGLRTEAGKPMEFSTEALTNERFAEYLDWRVDHPSDDIMTELLTVEFEDETGTVRRLDRDELLTYITVIAGAGSETTTRLISWIGKVLADHPDQRRAIVEDRSLIPAAVEEVLRFEPPAPHVGRYVANDVEFQGRTVPAGSAILLLPGAANRDEERWHDSERFDIHRDAIPHVAFGYGPHYCLGASLARIEGQIALDEVLRRFPEWEVDHDHARLSPTSTVRGWETLPVVVRSA